ncbi:MULTISPECIES: DUF6334 family protein [unclassified Chryseobacterium]|uniref:DUF6334 family protein n=1 Tax=unclassified Chryseobacterium TaxID=2593645 RepID=UPI00100A50A7|nr:MULTISPECIES: DUF6334 family protein [unclassified Chryseobacterium]RXM50625.1 hypothetical protein BOQ64_17955 [Chryseobacterium sp. CH25]RXM63259.1 hypothetical protein BOQ60_18150 [Chryseobacterium sp. CH1]
MKNDLHWILGKTIQSIYIKRDENYNNNIISIYLTIDNKGIVVRVNQDTDTILVDNLIHIDDNFKEDLTLSHLFVDKKIVSFWLPVNNLGFNDVFMLGLDRFIPTHLFSSIASCIKINIVKQID